MSSPAVEGSPSLEQTVPSSANSKKVTSTTTKMAAPGSTAPFPPPKTDKPRPHVCTTCMRSFARLEHLKRHERSHTKEKPFQCPECSRCFARRDLLLRHQQKLHLTPAPSSKPRNARRETTTAASNGRGRKNSIAVGNTSGARPRANTLSHIDTSGMNLATENSNRTINPGHSHHNSFNGFSTASHFAYGPFNMNLSQPTTALPKLETGGFSADMMGGLRTAPVLGSLGSESVLDPFGFGAHLRNNTINPHALHMTNIQGLGIDQSISTLQQMYNSMANSQAIIDDDTSFDWTTSGFDHQMAYGPGNDMAIDDTSPSTSNTNSPVNNNDMQFDMVSQQLQHTNMTPALWQTNLGDGMQIVQSPTGMEFASNMAEIMAAPGTTLSPKSMMNQGAMNFDVNLPTPPDMNVLDLSNMGIGLQYTNFPLPLSRDGGASTASTASMDSSMRQSSVTTMSSDLINDHTRNLVIAGLSQNSGFGHRKMSQPAIGIPISPASAYRSQPFSPKSFPSTHDLQRYVSAYIRCFHPHLPFLHLPSLNFECSEYATPIKSTTMQSPHAQPGSVDGGSCLMLSIAAIGAVYEQDLVQSRELFDYTKRLISGYLEDRRKANLNKTRYAPRHHSDSEDTPLWLVQAMLLNVIYGHNCGDQMAADISSNHCAALVSLARGAELARPYHHASRRSSAPVVNPQHIPVTASMGDGWDCLINEPDDSEWYEWKIMEERKRTLYAVFILSSMLVTAYNHAPALTNSEIRLDLPCDEMLWNAENPQIWQQLGGASHAEKTSVTFASALTHLLMSASRQQKRRGSVSKPAGESSELDLNPSTFGCLVLINALHNYIWETRQRHLGRQWTVAETERMRAHIEPALRAWQTAWASNPTHSLEVPNPFGMGPLSADSIPLLDLAYVRLFVNLGRTKEAFWQRNFDAMAGELARGVEGGQGQDSMATLMDGVRTQGQIPTDTNATSNAMEQEHPEAQATRRERLLRQAAFYAVDSLSVSDRLGLTFAEKTSRELPLQSAMCWFDCAQVLAEWVGTVQERVGKYVGVIGRDNMDLVHAPGILLLEDEDRKLLEKLDAVVQSIETKLAQADVDIMSGHEGGHASRILVGTARALEHGAVWPVLRLMAQSLETQAGHFIERAIASTTMA